MASCVIGVYCVLAHDGVSALRCRQERQHVLLLGLLEILREKSYSLVTSSHRISPRDLNSHQPVGTELGLSRNSVSKLGPVRRTVGQRIESGSVFDAALHNI